MLSALLAALVFAGPVVPEDSEPVPMTGRAFASTDADLPNPERGFYQWIDLENGRDFRYVRNQGVMLGYCSMSLAPYRDCDLPKDYLDRLSAGFDAVRKSGIKAIVRFKYANWEGDADASKERILGHLDQLAPLLQANSDVIAVLQAGFVGAWGEWHKSSHGLDNPRDGGDILRALLHVMPPERSVQVRTPEFKEYVAGPTPLTDEEAGSDSARARLGHHDDAFLGSWNDKGTYQVEDERTRVAAESCYLPMGGECNTLNPPDTDGWNTVAALTRFHYSFLSGDYLRAVIDTWTTEGYLAEIRKHLGYRISLLDAAWNQSVRPGGILQLSVHVRNSGYAAPFNARPLYVVLSGGGQVHAARAASVDVRRWEGGQDAWVNLKLRVPSHLAKGTYRMSLWLPDAALSLQYNPEYAIQLANDGIWDGSTGYNVVTEGLEIDPGAQGSATPSATKFEEVAQKGRRHRGRPD